MLGAVDISVSNRIQVPPAIVHGLGRRLRRAAGRLGVSSEQITTVAIHFADDDEICRLAARFYGERRPTDVLSFPIDDGSSLGDIALGWPLILARGYDAASWLDEATVLSVHGLVHLLGHDHRTAPQARKMHRLERRALAAIHVADVWRPYARPQ